MTQRHKVTGTNPAAFWLLIVLFLILAVTVTTVVFVVAPAQDLERTTQATAVARLAAVDQHYAAGLAYAQAGDWPAAVDAFRRALALDANYKDVQAQFQAASAQSLAGRYARGVGMMNLGRWAEAEQLLQEVFDVDPDYQAVQPLLGTVTAHLAAPTPTPTPAPPTLTPTPTVMPTPTPTPTPDQPAAGAVRTIGDPTFVYVPAGEFLMGSTDAQVEAAFAACNASGLYTDGCERGWFEGEQPQRAVALDAYWIGQTEVTNAQYQAFVDVGGYTTERFWSTDGWQWRSDNSRTGPGCWDEAGFNAADQPVVCVAWYEAEAYANWLAESSGETVRLPTEAEWEKAARGADGRIYPWGNDFDGALLNYCDVNCTNDWRDERFDDGVGNRTAPVGSYPAGASPYGALDMAGNVWEWTQNVVADGRYLSKGGSYSRPPEWTRAAARVGLAPWNWLWYPYWGFRVVVVPSLSQ